MKAYLDLAKKVLKEGVMRPNRTGTNALSIFGTRFEHNMADGFPLLTTKKMYFRGCIHELLWFLSGSTNIRYLAENNVHIWDAWADADGNLGPVYGKQWISYGDKGINQVANAVELIKSNPFSRRILIDAWKVDELHKMALPPCHILYQFYAEPLSKQLDLQVYMRSADIFLGVPFDIAEGGLLLTLMAEVTGYTPNKLIYCFGDTHIYENHIDQIKEQIERKPLSLPTVNVAPKSDIFDYKFEDIELINYSSHKPLRGVVAV